MPAQEINALFDQGVLDEEDMVKLAEVEADLIAASTKSGGDILETVTSILKEAGFEQGDYNRVVDFLDSQESKKEAAITLGRGSAIPLLATGILLALGGKAAYETISERSALKSSLATVKKSHPELKRDPMTEQHFQAIADFAPSIAKSPVVAGSLLLKMKQWGAIDHKTVQDLISMEKSLADIRQSKRTFPTTISGMKDVAQTVASGHQILVGRDAPIFPG